jgi:hypothetical protein
MGAGLAFWKAVVQDSSNFLEQIIALFEDNGIRYCVIGGVGVNAYVEPVVTQDLDVVVATDQIDLARSLAAERFRVRDFTYSINVYDPNSRLQVQIQRRPEMAALLENASIQEVLGLRMPVASPQDLVDAKVAAAIEETRRPSKRGKDIGDLARLVTRFPALLQRIPAQLRTRVEEQVDPADPTEEDS